MITAAEAPRRLCERASNLNPVSGELIDNLSIVGIATIVIQVPTTLHVSEQVNVSIIDGSYGVTVPLPPRPVSGN
jgi:hypothetical protein